MRYVSKAKPETALRGYEIDSQQNSGTFPEGPRTISMNKKLIAPLLFLTVLPAAIGLFSRRRPQETPAPAAVPEPS